jgi:exopolysaccharide biosynthesis polyprenyl glycosylphosphotransferase
MNTPSQTVLSWLQFRSGTGAARAPEPKIPSAGLDGAGWLNSTGSNRQGKDARTGNHIVGGRWVQVVYALIDVCCVAANGTVALLFRSSLGALHGFFLSGALATNTDQLLASYGGFLFLYIVLILLCCNWLDLYWTPRTRSSMEESIAVLKAVSVATLLLAAFIYLSGIKIVPRLVVLMSVLLNTMTLIAWRYVKRQVVIRRLEGGIGVRNVVIIGAGKVGQALARQMEKNKLLGYRFKGFLDANHSNDPHMLGRIEDLSDVARAEFVDDVFITIPSERELVKRIVVEARHSRINVTVIPELYDGLGWHAPIRHIGDFPVMDIQWKPIPTLGLLVKRIVDFVFAACASVIVAPLLIVLAVWIKLDTHGPVLYLSKRVGKKGRVFTCYKLRTMVKDANELKAALRGRNERQGPFFKIENDPRITRVGKWLRRYSLDELPQFWNVVKGDMSLVGPRPHPLDDCARYTLNQLRRLEVKPGLTGLWQVNARQDPSFETSMLLDLEYIENWRLRLDIKIILKTLPEVLRASGR